VRLGRDEEGGSNFPIRASMADFDFAQRGVIGELARRGVVSVTSEQRGTQTTLPPPTPGYPSAQTGARTEQSVGLADGRLVALWPMLVRWLEADREFLIWRQQLRDAKKAAAAYAGALEIDPRRLEAALKLGRAREAQGDFEGAGRACEEAMSIAPTSPAPWLERGARLASRRRGSSTKPSPTTRMRSSSTRATRARFSIAARRVKA
jgi:Flp pilus assembly protein TadD